MDRYHENVNYLCHYKRINQSVGWSLTNKCTLQDQETSEKEVAKTHNRVLEPRNNELNRLQYLRVQKVRI